MELNPYVMFNGQCETAFKFYEKHLGAKIESMMTHAGTPAEKGVPPEWRDKILHGRIVVGDTLIMASDAPPGRFEKPQGIWVSIQVKDIADADRIFKALSENGKIVMPIEKTFWAARFGMVIDQFGIPWMVNGGMTM